MDRWWSTRSIRIYRIIRQKSASGFAIYSIVFAVFVLINTFAPQLMKVKVILSLNLAVT
jgi:hypothetical protein